MNQINREADPKGSASLFIKKAAAPLFDSILSTESFLWTLPYHTSMGRIRLATMDSTSSPMITRDTSFTIF